MFLLLLISFLNFDYSHKIDFKMNIYHSRFCLYMYGQQSLQYIINYACLINLLNILIVIN